MNSPHFRYISERSHITKSGSDKLLGLALDAARGYVERGEDLNSSIRKMASRHDLNPHQVARVCEEANQATHKILWSKTAEKEAVAFPLANAKSVVDIIPRPASDVGCAGVPASVEADYMSPPEAMPIPKPPISMAVPSMAPAHTGMVPTDKGKLVIIIEKKAAERQRAQDQVFLAGAKREETVKQAYAAVKHELLSGTHSIDDLYQAAVASGMGKIATDMFPHFHKTLIKETRGTYIGRSIEKQAILKAPDELISKDMGNVTVVNSAHPVLVHLDTVQRQTGEVKTIINNLLRIDDELKIYKQNLQELS